LPLCLRLKVGAGKKSDSLKYATLASKRHPWGFDAVATSGLLPGGNVLAGLQCAIANAVHAGTGEWISRASSLMAGAAKQVDDKDVRSRLLVSC
jgi:hypothetical protein